VLRQWLTAGGGGAGPFFFGRVDRLPEKAGMFPIPAGRVNARAEENREFVL